jgi:molecular chaperone HscB
MTEESVGVQICPNCSNDSERHIHFCSECQKILPLPDRVDYFRFLEIPEKLAMDVNQLEKEYFRLSRKFHPDFYQRRPNEEQHNALDRSAALNRAYETLRDPVRRIEYLMRLRGFVSSFDKNETAREMSTEIFELQELLEEYLEADQTRREALSAEINLTLDEMRLRQQEMLASLTSLCQEYDEAPEATKDLSLTKMRIIIDRANYLKRIIENSEKTLGNAA